MLRTDIGKNAVSGVDKTVSAVLLNEDNQIFTSRFTM
jgi:hypothetical protein